MRSWVLFAAFVLGTVLVVTPAFAQSNFNSSVIGKDYFATGQNISLDGTVNGDAYVAGGDVTVNGTITGDLLIAGGNLNINGIVKGNIRGAGGNIYLNGKVERNVTLAGGSITLSPNASIAGNLTAAGGQLNVGNNTGGDINAAVGRLVLNSGAKVNGNVTYWSENKANIHAEASVSGRVTQNIPPRRNEHAKSGRAAASLFTAVKVFGLFSALVVGFILIKLLPEYTGRVASSVANHWLLSLGIGLLTLVVTPVLVFLLLVTIIGIPIAVLWLVFVFFEMWLAKIFVSLALGRTVMARSGQNWSSYLLLTLGLLAYYVVGIIPVIGGLFDFIVGLIGLGSIVLVKRNYYLQLSRKKVI